MLKKAKKFIKKYRLNKLGLSYRSLANIFNSLGYKIIFFNKFSNTCDIQKLINVCRLQKEIETRRVFMYVDGSTKLLFLHKGIAEDEKVHYMLHELGHIELKHIYIDTDEDMQEREADEFAVVVKLILKYRKKYIIAVLSVCLIVVNILSVCCINLSVKHTPISAVTYQQTTDFSKSDNVCVTKSGTKYHLPACQYVKYKTNIMEISKEEAIKCGYHACNVCNP